MPLAPPTSRAVAVAEATSRALDRWGMLWTTGLCIAILAALAGDPATAATGAVATAAGWGVLTRAHRATRRPWQP